MIYNLQCATRMDAEELKKRTKQCSLRIIALVAALPNDLIAHVLGRHLLKAGTSLGANYREALRATSRADFLAKIKIAEREIDELSTGLICWKKLASCRRVGLPCCTPKHANCQPSLHQSPKPPAPVQQPQIVNCKL